MSLSAESKECLYTTAKRVFSSLLPAADPPAIFQVAQNLDPNDTSSTVFQQTIDIRREQAKSAESIVNSTAHAKDHPVTKNNESIPIGVKPKSWHEWKRSRSWLSCDSGWVFSTACQNMHGKTVVFMNSNETRDDRAFSVLGVQAPTPKKWLKKIDKHMKTKRHEACVKSATIAASEPAEQAFSVQNTRFEELHMNQILATEKIFRVVYMCAKENLPFAKHPAIISCHCLNGAEMGSLLYSPVTCQDIVKHISSEIKKVLISYIRISGTKFSIMIIIMVNESTSTSAKYCLIIYIPLLFEDEVTNYRFIDFVELREKGGESIAQCIIQTLADSGLSVELLKNSLTGFASDGASAMRGDLFWCGNLPASYSWCAVLNIPLHGTPSGTGS